MTDVPLVATYRAVFRSRRTEYEGVETYRFIPDEPVPFAAGAYVHLRLPGVPDGENPVREFSFASAPHEREVRFAIDTRSGSPYQRALQALTEGDVVELFKIKTHLTWPPPDREVVMVAGGVGVTPFYSQLLDRVARALPISITLVHAAHGKHLYASELRSLADEYVPTDRNGLDAALASAIEKHPLAAYSIAGSGSFVAGAAGALRARSVARIEADNFNGLADLL